MTALAEQLKASLNGKTPNPEGFRLGQTDNAGRLWINKSKDGTKIFLSGIFGRGRLMIFARDTPAGEGAPPWYSYLGAQQTQKQKEANENAPNIPWNGFWENTTPQGVTYLSSSWTAATQYDTGLVLEFWPTNKKVQGAPDYIGRWRATPKLTAEEALAKRAANGTQEESTNGEHSNGDMMAPEQAQPEGIPF